MDKRNTLLLTVIAVATLLVAVVGATFAYFTAQMGPGTNTNITVTTSTQDTLTYGSFNALMLVANQENFAEGKGTQMATAQGTISLQANSNTQEGVEFPTVDYCYTATINVALNQFEYAPQDVVDKTEANGNDAELVLTITKDDHPYENGEIDKLTYVTLESQLVCDQSDGQISFTPEQCSTESFSGYDITEYGNISKNIGAEQELKIPNYEYQDEDENLKYVFHITADGAGKVTDHHWQADLYFVNRGWDQQYNTHKMFTATWNFKTVNCQTGLVDPAD